MELVRAALAAVLVSSAATGCAALGLDDTPVPVAVTDHAALARWQDALGPSLNSLNAAPEPTGLDAAGPATVSRCGIDSGAEVGGDAGRYWDVGADPSAVTRRTNAVTVRWFRELSDYLETDGWRRTEERGVGVEPVVDMTAWDFVSADGRVELTIQVVGQSVSAGLWFAGAPTICSVGYPESS